MSDARRGWIRPPWLAPSAPARAHALTTTRAGGLSRPPFATLNLGNLDRDDPAVVAANRHRIRRGLALPAEPRWLRQVHGTRVVRQQAMAADGPLEADAAWTDAPGVVCAVLTADCLPVVLASAEAVAAVHVGWRGLAAGILEATTAALPVRPGECRAWLGPAIGPRAFEIGPEVRTALLEHDPGGTDAFRRGPGDRWHADLYALARRRLRAAGLERIDGGGHCTFGEPDRFFSHRRDGAATGRMATLAWLDPT